MGGLPVCSSVPCDPSLQGKTAIFDSSNCIWNFGDAATGGGTTISFGAPNFTFGNANVEGASNRAVRTDATLDFFVAPTITFGTAHADGVSAKGIRSDATLLLFDAVAPSDPNFTAVVGAINLAARRDHVHRYPNRLMSWGADVGDALTLTSSADILTLTPTIAGAAFNHLLYAQGNSGQFDIQGVVTITGDPSSLNLTGKLALGGTSTGSISMANGTTRGVNSNWFPLADGLSHLGVEDLSAPFTAHQRWDYIDFTKQLIMSEMADPGALADAPDRGQVFLNSATGDLTIRKDTGVLVDLELGGATGITGFATPAFPWGTAYAAGAATTTVRSDATLKFPHALMSATATPGDTITLTSDGVDNVLTQSRAGAKLLFKDSAAATMLEIWPAATGSLGLATLGHAHFGGGTALYPVGPSGANGFIFDESLSTNPTTTTAFVLDETLNADFGGAGQWITGNYQTRLGNGWDPASGGGSTIISGLRSALSGSHTNVPVGSVSSFRAFDVNVNASLAATSPAWTEIVGLYTGSLSIGTVVPTKSYGIKVTSAGNGTSAFAASFVGMTQASTTSEIGLGRAQGVTPTNTISSKTSAGSILQMKLNSAQRYEWDTTAFYPVTNGAADVGKDNNGWGGLWFKDASAAFEDKVTYNSSATLTADRNRVMDFPDVNTTLKIRTGTASLNFGVALLNACEDLTLTVTGASDGDSCSVGAPAGSVVAGAQFTCWRSAADTVTIRHCCVGTAVTCADPASGTFRATTMSL